MAFSGLANKLRYLRRFFKATMEDSKSMVLAQSKKKLAPSGFHWVIIQEQGLERPTELGSCVLNVTPHHTPTPPLPPFSLPLSLSLSHTHTHTHTHAGMLTWAKKTWALSDLRAFRKSLSFCFQEVPLQNQFNQASNLYWAPTLCQTWLQWPESHSWRKHLANNDKIIFLPSLETTRLSLMTKIGM